MQDLEYMKKNFAKRKYENFHCLTPIYHIFRILKLYKLLELYFVLENKLVNTFPFLKKQSFLGLYIFEK